MVADPVPVATQLPDPGTGDPANLKESWLPVSDPVKVPATVTFVTAGEVSNVAGPKRVLPL
jgi:hypothetical protein